MVRSQQLFDARQKYQLAAHYNNPFFAFLSALPLDPCNSFGIQLFDRFKKESMRERDQYDYWTFVL